MVDDDGGNSSSSSGGSSDGGGAPAQNGFTFTIQRLLLVWKDIHTFYMLKEQGGWRNGEMERWRERKSV